MNFYQTNKFLQSFLTKFVLGVGRVPSRPMICAEIAAHFDYVSGRPMTFIHESLFWLFGPRTASSLIEYAYDL